MIALYRFNSALLRDLLDVGNQRQVARPLDSLHKLFLVFRAGAGNPPRDYLAALSGES